MLKYLVLAALVVILGVYIWLTFPRLLHGGASFPAGPGAIPRAVYHSLSQHLPQIPHS